MCAFVIFEFEVAAGHQSQCLHVAAFCLPQLSVADTLDLECASEHLECVFVAGDLEVAATECREYEGVVEFALADVS
jgi:hypothetical protein